MSSPMPQHPADPAAAAVVHGEVQRVLEFERGWVGTPAAKEGAIRSQLGLSATRYYHLLHRAIDDPAALEKDPMLVRRLQRLRAIRSRTRASRTFRTE